MCSVRALADSDFFVHLVTVTHEELSLCDTKKFSFLSSHHNYFISKSQQKIQLFFVLPRLCCERGFRRRWGK